ncbi:toll-like receptor 2 [Ornithorhynchus anatinus]|uniref:toll-like receptor 2 n=1 Tax=Ornithorhynchus anatinus TaxID=9258 RepID=UPI000454600D|nr:toll-like receptor 2 [Ornithorhynchus anatinus]
MQRHLICCTGILWALLNLTDKVTAEHISLLCDATGFCNGSSLAFSTIPPGLTVTVQQLDLSKNSIRHVGKTDLQNCVNLKALMLQANQIGTIDEDAFLSLGILELLDLSKNRLSSLSPSWFQSLSSLLSLNLLENPYPDLGQSPLFAHLKKLRSLKVGNGQYFSEIRKQDFEGISDLEELEIDGSNLQQYQPHSLQSTQNINHLLLNVTKSDIVLKILSDLTSSKPRNISMSIPVASPQLKRIELRHVEMTDESAITIFKMLSLAVRLLEVTLEDGVLFGVGDWYDDSGTWNDNYTGSLETVIIRRLQIPKFFLFRDMKPVYSLVGRLKTLTIENSKVFLVPCPFSRSFELLEYLDLSGNILFDELLKNSACDGAWPSLQTLNLSQNSLRYVDQTGASLSTLKKLINLDISQNKFDSMPESCQWPENLKYLNMSGTRIPRLTDCIPRTLEILDVSNNNLKDFILNLPRLKELYLSKNKLKTLPEGRLYPNLLVMRISKNALNVFSRKEFESFQKLKALEVGGNNFICSCVFLTFLQDQQAIASVLTDWPENYICDSPSHVRGQRVQDTHLPLFECHRALLVSVICCILFLIIILTVALCHHFHGIWYMKMTWAWLQAKRKPRKTQNKEIYFDAFVSYSEEDSYWVENLMVQELEHSNPPFRLCLHKRDFVPGKWIIDNIIDSIEKSHKTLFVLSENFVKSEWCKYELDFSHFRLFDENNDSAILILLEPIEKKAIPQRFCKLRKIMNTKTYLKWPSDETERETFWLNLKSAIKTEHFIEDSTLLH